MGKTFDGHLNNLEEVFSRLKNANLKLNSKKCSLFQREVLYLGHVVSAEGIKTDPTKISAIQDRSKSRDKHEVRQCLGLCTYYRKFVQNFGKIAKPLHRLTENNTSFDWDPECQNALTELKKRLATAPVLAYPKEKSLFYSRLRRLDVVDVLECLALWSIVVWCNMPADTERNQLHL